MAIPLRIAMIIATAASSMRVNPLRKFFRYITLSLGMITENLFDELDTNEDAKTVPISYDMELMAEITKKVKFQASAYQEYTLWLSQYIKYCLFYGFYCLGSNQPPEQYIIEYRKRFGLNVPVRGRKRDVNLETCDNMLCKDKWESFTLYSLHEMEQNRAKSIPPEIFSLLNVEQWTALYSKMCQLWDEYVELRNWFIQNNMPLIQSLAYKSIKFRPTTGAQSLNDLLNEAVKGAARAYDKYKYTSWMRISTLMAAHIDNVTKEAIDHTISIIHTPGHVQSVKRKIIDFEAKFLEEHKRRPTKEEIKQGIGKTKTNFENVYGVDFNATSLDATVGENDDTSLEEIIADPNTDFYKTLEEREEGIKAEAMGENIKMVLSQIKDPHVRTVVCSALLTGSSRAETVNMIAERMGHTKEYARRIISEYYRSLRRATSKIPQPRMLTEIRNQEETLGQL